MIEMKRTILIAFAAMVSGEIWAADIPKVDVEANCSREGHAKWAVNMCINLEQEAYDRIRLLWDDLTPEAQTAVLDKTSANRTMTPTSVGFYRDFLGYVEISIQQRRLKEEMTAPAPKFRY